VSVLSNHQLEAVHLASLRFLEEVGVEMLDHRALDLLATSGAEVDWSSKRVRMAPELVMDAVGRAPTRFTMHSRNPERAVEIGGDTMALAPVGGPAMATDLDAGKRPGSYADQVNFIKLSQHARLLDMAYRCVEAQDLPPSTRQLDYLYAVLRYTDKPLAVMSLDAKSAMDSLAIDTVAGVGPGGSYLMAGPTLAHYRGAVRLSPLMESGLGDGDEDGDSRPLLRRANALWKQWLDDYQEPALDPAVEEAARDYVERRERGEPPRPHQ